MPKTYLEDALARVRSDPHWPQIERLIGAGYLFAVNHSAGKDSQAMQVLLRHLVPAAQCASAWGLDADRSAKRLIENGQANVALAPIHTQSGLRQPRT